MKRYPISTKMVKMNYKNAATATPLPKNPIVNYSQESNEEYLRLIENKEFQMRANIKMNEIVSRFLNYKRSELELEGYDDEEIENIIEHLLNDENEEYDDYSSNEDDDSVYSDEDTF